VERVEVSFSKGTDYRPTEIVADLRNAVESLYHPMKAVAYWDVRTRDHSCPHALLGRVCPHTLPEGDPRHVPYERTVERDLDGVADVYFPHAQVHIYIG
jgi:hypothetical protein